MESLYESTFVLSSSRNIKFMKRIKSLLKTRDAKAADFCGSATLKKVQLPSILKN